jgi:hypothetical protein
MLSPGNKFIDNADAAEKLHILIAHHVKHLGPQQQAGNQRGDHDKPPKFSHYILRIKTLSQRLSRVY